jgi:hypothetical protein
MMVTRGSDRVVRHPDVASESERRRDPLAIGTVRVILGSADQKGLHAALFGLPFWRQPAAWSTSGQLGVLDIEKRG